MDADEAADRGAAATPKISSNRAGSVMTFMGANALATLAETSDDRDCSRLDCDELKGADEKSDSSSSWMDALLRVLLASDAANDSTEERPVLLFWRAQSLCAPTSSTEMLEKVEKKKCKVERKKKKEKKNLLFSATSCAQTSVIETILASDYIMKRTGKFKHEPSNLMCGDS